MLIAIVCDHPRKRRRHKRIESPRKPELAQAQKTLAKKRDELARMQERLQMPPMSGRVARELRKHVALLERELAALQG